MRALILAAGAALALAACGNNDQSDNTVNIDENLTAENIVSNDVTAIDAVTGDAANMAADVEITNDLMNVSENMGNAQATASGGRRAPRPNAPARAPAGQPAPAEATANNAT